jgi:hypothetical protein
MGNPASRLRAASAAMRGMGDAEINGLEGRGMTDCIVRNPIGQ